MSEVKRWLEEIWEVEEILGEEHPFEQNEVEDIALERLQVKNVRGREPDLFPHLKKLNAYLARPLVIPE